MRRTTGLRGHSGTRSRLLAVATICALPEEKYLGKPTDQTAIEKAYYRRATLQREIHVPKGGMTAGSPTGLSNADTYNGAAAT